MFIKNSFWFVRDYGSLFIDKELFGNIQNIVSVS